MPTEVEICYKPYLNVSRDPNKDKCVFTTEREMFSVKSVCVCLGVHDNAWMPWPRYLIFGRQKNFPSS